MPDQPPTLLTVTEAAAWLRVHPETLKRAARRGTVPVVRLSRQELRFEPATVLAALCRGSNPQPPQK